jgi:hypothetical protein
LARLRLSNLAFAADAAEDLAVPVALALAAFGAAF